MSQELAHQMLSWILEHYEHPEEAFDEIDQEQQQVISLDQLEDFMCQKQGLEPSEEIKQTLEGVFHVVEHEGHLLITREAYMSVFNHEDEHHDEEHPEQHDEQPEQHDEQPEQHDEQTEQHIKQQPEQHEEQQPEQHEEQQPEQHEEEQQPQQQEQQEEQQQPQQQGENQQPKEEPKQEQKEESPEESAQPEKKDEGSVPQTLNKDDEELQKQLDNLNIGESEPLPECQHFSSGKKTFLGPEDAKSPEQSPEKGHNRSLQEAMDFEIIKSDEADKPLVFPNHSKENPMDYKSIQDDPDANYEDPSEPKNTKYIQQQKEELLALFEGQNAASPIKKQSEAEEGQEGQEDQEGQEQKEQDQKEEANGDKESQRTEQPSMSTVRRSNNQSLRELCNQLQSQRGGLSQRNDNWNQDFAKKINQLESKNQAERVQTENSSSLQSEFAKHSLQTANPFNQVSPYAKLFNKNNSPSNNYQTPGKNSGDKSSSFLPKNEVQSSNINNNFLGSAEILESQNIFEMTQKRHFNDPISQRLVNNNNRNLGGSKINAEQDERIKKFFKPKTDQPSIANLMPAKSAKEKLELLSLPLSWDLNLEKSNTNNKKSLLNAQSILAPSEENRPSMQQRRMEKLQSQDKVKQFKNYVDSLWSKDDRQSRQKVEIQMPKQRETSIGKAQQLNSLDPAQIYQAKLNKRKAPSSAMDGKFQPLRNPDRPAEDIFNTQLGFTRDS